MQGLLEVFCIVYFVYKIILVMTKQTVFMSEMLAEKTILPLSS